MRSQQKLDSCFRRNDGLDICCRYIHCVQDSPHPHPLDCSTSSQLRAGMSLSLWERVVFLLPVYVYTAGAASVTSSSISSPAPCTCCAADDGSDDDDCP